MTELRDLDLADALTAEELLARIPAPLPSQQRPTARWVVDAETGRPVCVWSVAER